MASIAYRQRQLTPGALWAAEFIEQVGTRLMRDEVTVLAIMAAHVDLDLNSPDGYQGHTIGQVTAWSLLDEIDVQESVEGLAKMGALVPVAGTRDTYRLPELAFV